MDIRLYIDIGMILCSHWRPFMGFMSCGFTIAPVDPAPWDWKAVPLMVMAAPPAPLEAPKLPGAAAAAPPTHSWEACDLKLGCCT